MNARTACSSELALLQVSVVVQRQLAVLHASIRSSRNLDGWPHRDKAGAHTYAEVFHLSAFRRADQTLVMWDVTERSVPMPLCSFCGRQVPGLAVRYREQRAKMHTAQGAPVLAARPRRLRRS